LVLKTAPPGDLVDAMRRVACGGLVSTGGRPDVIALTRA
jgi:hypothetical protein